MSASKIDTKKVRIDLGTQSRVTIDPAVVAEYAEAMERGNRFPPIKVYYDMEQDVFILVDGFHRFLAWCKVFPNDPIMAEQSLGTVSDAVWESFAVNADHGLRRTNADKRKAVAGALMHERGVRMSDRAIAEHCKVGYDLVGRMRKELVTSARIGQMDAREVTRNGVTYIQNTANIGSASTPDPLANTHENYAERLAQCCKRKQNEFKRNYDVVQLRCARCSLYQDMDGTIGCANTGEPREPDALVCDYFDYYEPYTPPEKKPVENAPLDGGYLPPDRSGKLTRTYGTYADRGSVTVVLPPANPTLFVHELISHFDRDYLATILPVLHQRLTEKDDDDD